MREGYIGEDAICRAAARHECLPYDDFFGYFLVRRQESDTHRQFAKLNFVHRYYRIGRSGEMLNGPKARIACRGIPADKLRFEPA